MSGPPPERARPWVVACEGQGARLLPATHAHEIVMLVPGAVASADGTIGLGALPPSIAQPAFVAHQVLAARALVATHGHPAGAIGQSLGELSALVVAGSLEVDGALAVARERADLADRLGDGTAWMMVAVTRTPLRVVAGAARAAGGWVVAHNAPDDAVVVVEAGALTTFVELAGVDASTSRPLPVVHPYHTPRLDRVAEQLRTTLALMPVAPPSIPVVSAVVPGILRTAADVRRSIVDGLTRPIDWAAALMLGARTWTGATWRDCGPSGALRRFVWKNSLDLDWRSAGPATTGLPPVERSVKAADPAAAGR